MEGFRTLTYEAVEVGETFVSDDFLIKPEDVDTYAFAVDDHHPWFSGESPFGGPVVHPTLLGNQALGMRHSRYVVEAGLHARMRFEFVRPIRVGMRVRSRGRVVDKYERRGRHYMVTEFVTCREELDGTTGAAGADEAAVLVRGGFTQMIIPAGRAHDAPARDARGRDARSQEVPPRDERPGPVADAGGGRPLGPLVKAVSSRQIDAYSGVRPHSIHTDPAWARQKGFAGPLAQGMMSTAYVSELMTGLAGERFLAGGAMSVAFTRPVVAGDVLTVHGAVREGQAAADGRLVVDVWCHNQHGERTMVGTAGAGPAVGANR